MERTVDFYTNVLGMPLVKTIELPAGMGQHFFFDCGGGDCLAFFWFPDAPDGVPGISAPAARPDQGDLTSAIGSMNHVAFDVAPEKIEEYRDRLVAAGVHCTEVANHDDSEWGISDEMHPGVFVRSVYFQDPDGILLEFACWMRSFTPSDVAHAPAKAPAKAEDVELAAEPELPAPAAPRRRRRPGSDADPIADDPRPIQNMPRLRQVPKDEATAPIVTTMYEWLFEGRDPVAEPGRWDGTTGDWWTVFANSPDILDHCVKGFGLYQSPDRTLDPKLRELGQIRAGYAAASQFVYSQHAKSMRELGMPEEQITHIPAWSVAPEGTYNAAERAVLAYTDCLVYDHGRVPDELFAELRRHLDDVAILELTYITTLYFQHAVMSKALRTEFDDRDDPIVEVPGPEGASAMHPGRSR